jgi:hypothetical protein
MHLIGDLHQPLHCATRVGATRTEGDDGGNGVKPMFPSNLHSYWDGVLGGDNSPSTALNAISTLPNAPAAAASDLDVSHWIEESFEAAKQAAYKKPPIGAGAGPFTLSQTYKTAARKLAEKRIALAGARLAKILKEELR